MRHLTRLFQRSSKIFGKIRHDVLRPVLALPTELFIHIVSFIEHKRDLATLCLVSKTFRDICMPLLYRHVHIGTWQYQVETYSGIYKVLQWPSIIRVVVVLSVSLDNIRLCGRWNPNMHRFLLLRNRQCTCMSHDSSLGEVILSLRNLQTLSITCRLCRLSHGHEYLFKLNSPAPRQFKLHCYESTAFGKDTDSRSILLAPFMSQLAALSLDCEQTWRRSRWNRALSNEPLFQEAKGLSHLDTLVHNGSPFFDFLLSHCRIRRLYFIGSEALPAPMRAIRRSPGRLTHLFSPNLMYWLRLAMKGGIEPYIHLRFIAILKESCSDVGSSQIREDKLD